MTTDLPALTRREFEVAVLLVDTDLSVRQIGRRLGISGTSVQGHACQIYRKLDVGSREHLRSVMLELELAPVGAR